jgi:chromosomal replication initiation ATPase DnaA
MPHAAELAPKVLAALVHPRSRPVALQGRSGSGKTTLLRSLTRATRRDAVWCSAFDLVSKLADAIRGGRYESLVAGLARDDRPLCVEHLEDLRGKPCTREELRRVLARAARRRPVLLTVTRSRGAAEVVRWLRPWAELLSLD